MPEFHYLVFRTHLHATEDPSKVVAALRFAIGDEKAAVSETKMEGHHGNPILLLEHEVKAKKAIDRFFDRLGEIAGALETLLRQREARMDDDGVFYLRLAKQRAVVGALELGYDEDTIHVRGKLRAYPSRRDAAMVSLAEYLEERMAKRERRASKTDAAAEDSAVPDEAA